MHFPLPDVRRPAEIVVVFVLVSANISRLPFQLGNLGRDGQRAKVGDKKHKQREQDGRAEREYEGSDDRAIRFLPASVF